MSTKTKIIGVVLLIILGVASRFLPHAWNFTPITAIILFSSAYFGLRYSVVALFSILFLSDLFLGFYHWPILLAVYVCFALTALVGLMVKDMKFSSVFVGTISSSLVFFLITNWAVWQFGSMYEHTWSGLTQSYVMALPFFRNSLAGDLFYSGILFGSLKAFFALKKGWYTSVYEKTS